MSAQHCDPVCCAAGAAGRTAPAPAFDDSDMVSGCHSTRRYVWRGDINVQRKETQVPTRFAAEDVVLTTTSRSNDRSAIRARCLAVSSVREASCLALSTSTSLQDSPLLHKGYSVERPEHRMHCQIALQAACLSRGGLACRRLPPLRPAFCRSPASPRSAELLQM